MSRAVLVAGIGNIFLGDDGFGVEVARRLAVEPQFDSVTVMDVGIRSLHLVYELLEPPRLLLVVDAVRRGQRPGTIFLIEPTIEDMPETTTDAHGMNLETVLSAVKSLGAEAPRVLLVGCEPEFTGERLGLSAAVEDAIPRALDMVRRVIARELMDPAAAGKETTTWVQ